MDNAGDVQNLKAALRAASLARRDALGADMRLAVSKALVQTAPPVLGDVGGKTVSGFWPIRSELDPRYLMRRLEEQGARLALPCIAAGRLMFRGYAFGDRLRLMGFGLSEPLADVEAVDPEIMLVPLAAFDRRGGRIGYGKGYYDGAIGRLAGMGRKPRLLGLAFACQEADAVPIEAHDQRLDAILTENRLVEMQEWQPPDIKSRSAAG